MTGYLQCILNVNLANAGLIYYPLQRIAHIDWQDWIKSPLCHRIPLNLSQIPSPLTVYVMVSSVSWDLTNARVSIVRKRAFNIVNLK